MKNCAATSKDEIIYIVVWNWVESVRCLGKSEGEEPILDVFTYLCHI